MSNLHDMLQYPAIVEINPLGITSVVIEKKRKSAT